MRTLEAILKDASDEPAFSNGEQGMGFMYRWCGQCVHDDLEDTSGGVAGCPVLASTMLGKTPAEFHATSEDAVLADFTCIEFRERGSGPSEPTPIPDPPDQCLLLPREPFEGVRMYADVTAGARPQRVAP